MDQSEVELMRQDEDGGRASRPAAATELHAMESSIRGIRAEQEMWRDEIGKLKSENLQLKSKFDELTEMMRSRIRYWSLVSMENSALVEKTKKAEDRVRSMESEIQSLREENLLLQRSSDELALRNDELQREVEVQANELSAQSDTNCYGINVSKAQRGKLEEQILVMTKHISKSKVVMENIESKLTARISAKIKTLNKQKEALDKLVESYRLKKAENSCAMATKDEMIRTLMATGEECEKEYIMVTERLHSAEVEKASAEKEVVNLRELVETLEVHLKLLNQKLKITKSEHKEKDESSQKRIRDLQDKCRRLEEHCEALYEEIRYMEIEFEQIKEVVEIGLTDLDESLDRLEAGFSERITCAEAQLSRCYEGFQSLKGAASSRVDAELERHEMLVRVMYQEEIIQVMEEESGKLAEKLKKKEEEERRLIAIARDHEMKVQELVAEARARVKEEVEERIVRNDEKGEILTQLCMLMKYYHDNCDNFLRKLSSKLKQIKPFR